MGLLTLRPTGVTTDPRLYCIGIEVVILKAPLLWRSNRDPLSRLRMFLAAVQFLEKFVNCVGASASP